MSLLLQIAYLVTAVLVVSGMMRLRSPSTARRGNALVALGMSVTIAAILDQYHHWSVPLIMMSAIVLGVAIGGISARRVRMTAMPQMVALFNGMGGGAAALVAIGVWLAAGKTLHGLLLPVLFTIFAGSVSFFGSSMAFLKLMEWLPGRPLQFSGQRTINVAWLVLLVVGGTLWATLAPSVLWGMVAFVVGSAVLGVSVLSPIGGADMPVMISLLNAMTGLSAAATGFLMGNTVLIIAGTLVGASGTILTQQMSRAMNRPLMSIIRGGFGQKKIEGHFGDTGTVVPTSVDDVAALLLYSRRVVIVPGYGLAVSRAQQELRQLADRLSHRGVDVRYAIHPVAGRMPGHMNVLLAEAHVPYDRLYDLEAINPYFNETDVALVIGANDVINPAARTEPNSPLFGMPILHVDKASRIVVLKRGMSHGFAGVDNPIYSHVKTNMLFGDAKQSMAAILRAVDEVS